MNEMDSSPLSDNVPKSIIQELDDANKVHFNKTLLETLEIVAPVESRQRWLRVKVIRKLQKLANRCVQKILTDEKAATKFYPFGFSKLGIFERGAFLEILVVTPKKIHTEEFLGLFLRNFLKKQKRIKMLPTPTARTPMINLRLFGVQVQLKFAQSPNDDNDTTKFDILSDSFLQNSEEDKKKEFNGPRNAAMILKVVPRKFIFCAALRVVKLWAKNRGVYGKTHGYLGGMTCAILVARVCQDYPNDSLGSILAHFFSFCKNWPWPNPVHLDGEWARDEEQTPTDGVQPRIRQDLLQVIMPCKPWENTAHAASVSTLKILLHEWERGDAICQGILEGNTKWEALWEEVDFFARYPFYLRITIAAIQQDDFLLWKGFVSSKLRHLLFILEQVPNLSICLYPKRIKNRNQAHFGKNENNTSVLPHAEHWFFGMDYTQEFAPNFVNYHVSWWKAWMYHLIGNIGFTLTEGMLDPECRLTRRLDVSFDWHQIHPDERRAGPKEQETEKFSWLHRQLVVSGQVAQEERFAALREHLEQRNDRVARELLREASSQAWRLQADLNICEIARKLEKQRAEAAEANVAALEKELAQLEAMTVATKPISAPAKTKRGSHDPVAHASIISAVPVKGKVGRGGTRGKPPPGGGRGVSGARKPLTPTGCASGITAVPAKGKVGRSGAKGKPPSGGGRGVSGPHKPLAPAVCATGVSVQNIYTERGTPLPALQS